MQAPTTIAEYRRPPTPGARQGGGRGPAPADHLLVSIVTVVYQGRRHLQAAIDSVASQDHRAIEYIVIDGGSNDGTLEILQQNDRHISCWRSEPDRGIYDAMNKGIALARGRLIKLLNADDVLCPGAVRRAVAAYEEGAGRGGVLKSDLELIDADGNYIKLLEARRAIHPLFALNHPSWFVDREVYERYGLYDPSYRVAADYEMNVRLQRAGVPFVHLDTPLVRFRVGGVSSTLAGLREGYRANRTHLGRLPALRALASHGYVKVRGRILRSLLDEHQLATVQRWMRRVRSAR